MSHPHLDNVFILCASFISRPSKKLIKQHLFLRTYPSGAVLLQAEPGVLDDGLVKFTTNSMSPHLLDGNSLPAKTALISDMDWADIGNYKISIKHFRRHSPFGNGRSLLGGGNIDEKILEPGGLQGLEPHMLSLLGLAIMRHVHKYPHTCGFPVSVLFEDDLDQRDYAYAACRFPVHVLTLAVRTYGSALIAEEPGKTRNGWTSLSRGLITEAIERMKAPEWKTPRKHSVLPDGYGAAPPLTPCPSPCAKRRRAHR